MEEGTMAALKDNVLALDDGVAMFSDDVRDAIKGHVFFEELPGFINPIEAFKQTVMMFRCNTYAIIFDSQDCIRIFLCYA